MYSKIINDFPGISDLTKKNYNYKAKKCETLGIDITASENKIITNMKNLTGEKQNCIMSYINVCIVIRREIGLPTELLISYRNSLRNQIENNITETNLELLKKDLPVLDELIRYTNEQYEKKDYRSYIINYLLINFNCRLSDLDLFISHIYTSDKNNYLLINGDKVTLIRNNYKTSKIYGQKVDEINDLKVYKSCQELLKNTEMIELIENFTNKNNYIRKKLYKGLSPSQYFKITVKEADKNDLLKLSKNRGTSVETILKNYNITRKN